MQKQGDCFRWALWEAVRNGGNLVHGWIIHPFFGSELMAHAWVERDGFVYDWQTCAHVQEEPRSLAEFYELRKPVGLAVYPGSPRLIGRAHQEGHYGPWHRAPWSDPNWVPE